MQLAKDSFYVALRDRLSAANPERTVVVDGVARPAIVVVENEGEEMSQTDNTFRVQWGASTAVGGGSRLSKVECTVSYATRGLDGTTGDRGRTLGKMDGELMVMCQPLRAVKMDYTLIPAKSMGTMLFWTDPEFEAVKDEAGRIQRCATTTLYFFRSVTETEVEP
jgi:hypothetical protein